jgi:hypothetical protein
MDVIAAPVEITPHVEEIEQGLMDLSG